MVYVNKIVLVSDIACLEMCTKRWNKYCKAVVTENGCLHSKLLNNENSGDSFFVKSLI
jgi:hypothetical protein